MAHTIMTNITLSIEDSVYKEMKKYSEIKWSEFVRKSIVKRLGELKNLDENTKETLLCMLTSEEVLKKDWLSKEDEEAWKDL